MAGITKDLNMLVAKSSRKFSFADGMEAELASEPPPEMFDKMEGTVLHVAFIFFLCYGISCDGGIAAFWIIRGAFFICVQGNSYCQQH